MDTPLIEDMVEDRFGDVIGDMVGDVIGEMVALSDDDLDASIRSLELQRRDVTSRLACAIAVADARGLYGVDGHRTMQGYLRATCNWSNHEVAKMRSLARLIDQHPAVGGALMDGRIGGPQAFELAKVFGNRRVRDRFGEFVPILLRSAEELSFDDFRVVVQRFVSRADTDGTHRDIDDAVEHRDARVVDVGGAIDMRMSGGDPLLTAELLSIFNGFVDAEFHADLAARSAQYGDADDEHELPRTVKQRRFDAAIAMMRAAHTATTAGTTAGTTVGTTVDPLVNVVVDAATFARVLYHAGLASNTNLAGEQVDPFTGLVDTGQVLDDLTAMPDLDTIRCETTNGVVLHPHQVLRAALSGHVRRVVIDAAGVVIDQGRKQRLFTGSARRAALVLVRHCEHPGCDLPAERCQVDHVHEWTDGGATDQANSSVRCGGHNRVKHRSKLRSKRAANGRTYTIRTDGTVMLPAGARVPVFADDDDVDVEDPADIVRLTQHARTRAAALRPTA